jgi:Adenine specific DNA methylase Mod
MPLLDWLNKSQALKAAASAPFRLLDEVPELSYGDEASDNMLIQGDNLDGLKALLPLYTGKVKCIFIDPPYNTQSAFEHYDDNLEHSIWLSLLYPRIELMRELLCENGTIWISIDDNEAHYLKVIMDEIYGRRNFVANVIWEKSDSPKMDSQFFSTRHDHVLMYAKNKEIAQINHIKGEIQKHYNRVDDKGRKYYTKPLRAMGGQGETRESRPTLYYPIKAPDATDVYPKLQNGRDGAWRWSEVKVKDEWERIDWVNGRKGWTPYFRIYAEESVRPPETIWTHTEVGSNRTSKAEVKAVLPSDDIFGTPKPERLIQRIIQISTNENDLVLDSFLGSGTTAAVAHKMNRRYIGIELGDHAQTHCAVRLKKVIDGEQGGISEAVNWKGGGGFRFYKLGAEIFLPNGTINPDVKFKQLASFVWFAETKRSLRRVARNPLLGIHEDTAYYLLYNGILGDHRPNGGNVLTRSILKKLPSHDGPKIIYGDSSLLGVDTLKKNKIVFKQIPYEVRTR